MLSYTFFDDAAVYHSDQIFPLFSHLSQSDVEYHKKVLSRVADREVGINFTTRYWVVLNTFVRKCFISKALFIEMRVIKGVCGPSLIIRAAYKERYLRLMHDKLLLVWYF